MTIILWIKRHRELLVTLLFVVAWVVSIKLASDAGAAQANSLRDLAEAKQAKSQQQAIAKAEKAARDAEHLASVRVAAIESFYLEQKDHEKTDRDRVIADVRSGQRRMYVNVRASSGASAGSTQTAGNPDQKTRAELSPADGEFLIRFGAEADDVVLDLNRCIDRADVMPE